MNKQRRKDKIKKVADMSVNFVKAAFKKIRFWYMASFESFWKTLRWAKYSILISSIPALVSIAAYYVEEKNIEIISSSYCDFVLVIYAVSVAVYGLIHEKEEYPGKLLRLGSSLAFCTGLLSLILYITAYNKWTLNPTIAQYVQEERFIDYLIPTMAGSLILNLVFVFANFFIQEISRDGGAV